MTDTVDAVETVKTYRARRRLKITPIEWREPHQLYPEGHLLFRIDAHVHQGRVVEVDVPKDEFLAALEAHVGDEHSRQRILAIVGLDPDVKPTGPHHSPRPRKPTTPQAVIEADKPADKRVGGPKGNTGRKRAVPPTKRVGAKKVPTVKRSQLVGNTLIQRPVGETDHPGLVPLRTIDE